MQNISGQEFDYAAFEAEYDETPQLQELVTDFNDSGIILKTKHQKHAPAPKDKTGSSVRDSAKKAAAKRISK